MGEEKQQNVFKNKSLALTKGVCCPVLHIPINVAHPGTVEVELISTVFWGKVLAPDLDVALALSSSRSMTGGVGDSFSAVFQHKKPHGNEFLISVVCFPSPLM